MVVAILIYLDLGMQIYQLDPDLKCTRYGKLFIFNKVYNTDSHPKILWCLWKHSCSWA